MIVEPVDLGTAVCRSVMRSLDDRPILLERYGSPPEVTTAGERVIAMQWCAVLLPLPDMVSVRAHLKYWGMGIWDRAELSPAAGPSFRELIFVPYPDDLALIVGPGFERALREAAEKALDAAEADRVRVRAEFAAKRGGSGG